MKGIGKGHLLALAGTTAASAALVTGSYLARNDWTLPGAANLYVAMSWLCLTVNLGIAAGFLLLVLAGRMLPSRFRLAPDPGALLGALIVGNVTWILWNRLGMAHQWAAVRPFLTATGAAQNLLLLIASVALVYWSAGLVRPRPPRRRGPAALLLATGILCYALSYLLTLREERGHRQVDLAALQVDAQRQGVSPRPASVEPVAARPRLTVLAIDGLEWSVLEPLLAQGLMPNLQAVIADGAIGYLDNFDESLSPRVWSTITTGHLPRQHGIGHFIELMVWPTGQGLPHPPFTTPSTDYFYGVLDVAFKIPTLGLWSIERQMRGERRQPSVWEIASHYGRAVGVVNGVSHLPVGEVDGFWIDMDTKLPPASTFYPLELAAEWQPSARLDSARRGSQRWIDEGIRFVREEYAFALELYDRFDVDLAWFYTHLVDTAHHMNWNYWARGSFFLRDLPSTWTRAEWARSVVDHLDDPVFKGYTVVDELVGMARAARPDGDLVILSDHGWTYSGYEHMVSPAGVILLAGPSFGTGTVDLDILEIAPTLLATLRLPLAEAIAPRARLDLLSAIPHPDVVAEYPPAALSPASPPELTDNESEMERLRALGYIN